MAITCHVPWAAHLLQKIPLISREVQRIRKHGVECANRRIQAGASTKDLWYHLVCLWRLFVCRHVLNGFQSDDAGVEKEKPPVGDVVADGDSPAVFVFAQCLRQILSGALIIIAGSDTTSAAMAGLFYLLLSNPYSYRQVQMEVDTIYPSGTDPLDASKHGELKYLNACL